MQYVITTLYLIVKHLYSIAYMLQQSQPYRLILSMFLGLSVFIGMLSCTNTSNTNKTSAAELTFNTNYRIIDSLISTYQTNKATIFLQQLNNEPQNNYLRYYYWMNYYRSAENFDSLHIYVDSAINTINKLSNYQNYKALLSDAYAKRGEAELGSLQYEQATNSFFSAKQIAYERNDTCAASRYTYRLGMACYRQGNYTLAAKNFQQAFSESEHCDANNYTHYYKR
ncbi:MAG: hypothetical protein ACK4HE_12435 [Chitinophagaceae bacterium]